MLIAIVASIIGGIVGALVTRWLTPNPTREIEVIKADVSGLKEHFVALEREGQQEKGEDTLWRRKLDRVVAQLKKIGPATYFNLPCTSTQTALYTLVFQNPDTRQKIEEHLVESRRGTQFSARDIDNEKLRRRAVREIIEEAQARIDVFWKAQPEIAKQYLLRTEDLN